MQQQKVLQKDPKRQTTADKKKILILSTTKSLVTVPRTEKNIFKLLEIHLFFMKSTSIGRLEQTMLIPQDSVGRHKLYDTLAESLEILCFSGLDQQMPECHKPWLYILLHIPKQS